MSTSQQRPPSNVVRAWIDTILAPMLGGLELSQRFLQARNWTWKYYTGNLEQVRPVRAYVDDQVRWNLRQFEEIYSGSEVLRTLEEYDKSLHLLSQACSSESQTYLEASDFLKTIDRLLTAERNWDNGNGEEHHDREYLLEYLVNNREDLPPYYVLSRFWHENRNHLLDLIRNSPDLVEAKEVTTAAGEASSEACEKASRSIWTLMNDFSIDHGLPIVASAS